jgi:hypothetical protein
MTESYGLLPKSSLEEIGTMSLSDSPIKPNLQNRQYIASGAYGATIRPALPNYDAATKQWTEYPEDITKLFFIKKKKNEAVRKQRLLKTVVNKNNRNKNLAIHEYSYKNYTFKNLPNSVKSEISAKIGSVENTPLHLVRLPNLGHDIFTYVNSIYVGDNTVMNRLFNIPFNKSIGEIKKILDQIYTLYSEGYLHGDIKIDNLMMKDDGTLTLIDYDFFGKRDEFYNFLLSKDSKTSLEYFGFTNQPPESFLYFLLNNINTYIDLFNTNYINNDEKYRVILNQIYTDLSSNKFINHRIKEYIQYNSRLLSFVGLKITPKIFYNSLAGNLEDFLKIFYKYSKGRSIPDFFKVYILEKFDSYNAGISLLLTYYVFYYYTFNTDNASILNDINQKLKNEQFDNNNIPKLSIIYYNLLENIKNNVLTQMIEPYYFNRINIRNAVITMNQLFQESANEINKLIKPKNNNKTAKRSRNNYSSNTSSENTKRSKSSQKINTNKTQKKLTNFFKKQPENKEE